MFFSARPEWMFDPYAKAWSWPLSILWEWNLAQFGRETIVGLKAVNLNKFLYPSIVSFLTFSKSSKFCNERKPNLTSTTFSLSFIKQVARRHFTKKYRELIDSWSFENILKYVVKNLQYTEISYDILYMKFNKWNI